VAFQRHKAAQFAFGRFLLWLGLALAAGGCIGGPHPVPPFNGSDSPQAHAAAGGGAFEAGNAGSGAVLNPGSAGAAGAAGTTAAGSSGAQDASADCGIDGADAGVSCDQGEDSGALKP
jgi:hypothetical protein